MKKILVMFSMFFLTANISFANQVPRALATDSRIKIVSYKKDDIVTIHSSHFVSTAITFGQDEVITHIDMGDQIAWEVSVAKATPNILFIKPKLPSTDTNMSVITNKHFYQFRIFTNDGDTPTSRNVMYGLQFKYPEEEKQIFTAKLENLQKSFLGKNIEPQQWNYEYTFYGSKKIAPIQVVDNGTFTIFKFPKRSIIPAIFKVDAHRNESLVNFKVQGDYVFVQSVGRQFTLRNGQEVTTVFNECYS